MSELPPSLKAKVLSQTRAYPAPTRAQMKGRLALLGFGAVALLTALAVRKGAGVVLARPFSYNAVLLFSFASALGLLLVPLARFIATPLGPSRALLRSRTRAVLPLLTSGVILANFLAPETWTQPLLSELWRHPPCFALSFGAGSAVTLLAFSWLRGSDQLAPRVTGRAIGAFAGVAAALATSLSCHFIDPGHVLVSHVLPAGFVALLGGGLAARMLAVRSKPQSG
jgi:hypothetical protein